MMDVSMMIMNWAAAITTSAVQRRGDGLFSSTVAS
jgi:hypothetical protein